MACAARAAPKMPRKRFGERNPGIERLDLELCLFRPIVNLGCRHGLLQRLHVLRRFPCGCEIAGPCGTQAAGVIDVDGSAVDVFPLRVEEAALEVVLRDLFENHRYEITFGPIIQGAAYEFKAPSLPTHICMFDRYSTIAFGAPHFHTIVAPTVAFLYGFCGL
jgi:hypothetical protein